MVLLRVWLSLLLKFVLVLRNFGRSTQVFLQTQQVSDEEKLVEALVKSVAYMSPRKIGALISIERTQTLQEYISTGILWTRIFQVSY